MSDPSLAKILRDIKFAEALQPAEILRQQEANKRVIDVTGSINTKAANPFRTPLVMHWASGDTSRKRVARAGTVALLGAYASTAPSSGDAKVTLTSATAASGTETLIVLTIPVGSQFADVTTAISVPSGSWLSATVTTANGVAGVSISVTINQG